MDKSQTQPRKRVRRSVPETVAVIEIGTTAIRLVIAEIQTNRRYRVIESLQRGVSLGRHTFALGHIPSEATEECVAILCSYGDMLRQYGVIDNAKIIAVATSAVREASNRGAFLDRIFIATGLEVTAIDSAEVNRFTYLAAHPLLKGDPALSKSYAVIVEVGGGSTEVLAFRRGRVRSAHTYRLGSFRLRQMMTDFRAPLGRLPQIMQSHVDRLVRPIVVALEGGSRTRMMVLGSDARIAASALSPSWDHKSLARVPVSAMSRLTAEVLGLSVEQVARRYHIPYPEAELLGPALLINDRFARMLGLRDVVVGSPTLRDGILSELAAEGRWSVAFKRQIVNSAVELGRKYHFDEKHARHVSKLSVQLFGALQSEHRLEPKYELLMTIAGLLHDVGLFISTTGHHKHSMYVLRNSDIFGLGSRDILLTALVVRYHRRALPRSVHGEYSALARGDRVTVSKLAAILRVADALDRGHVQRHRDLDVRIEPDQVVIGLRNAGDLTLELHGLQEKGQMFESVYGREVTLRRMPGPGDER